MEFSVKPNSFGPILSVVPVLSRRDDARFARLARAERKARWAVKSPSNVCRLGCIFKALPAARVVMLVRDGRDVMLSLRERFRGASPAGPHVLGRWVNDNTAGLRYERDPRMLVVRLEDLARPPYATLRRVLRHYGLAFDDALIHQMVSGSGHGEARRANRARARPPLRARCSPRGGSGGRVDSARARNRR